MHVSSYLEAFLSVYGWMMYNTLYDLLGMTWLIFLPFMKLGITTFIDTLADSGNSYAQFKKGLITFLLMVLAMFMALVPLDKITVRNAQVNSVCSVDVKVNKPYEYLKSTYRFDVDEGGKVPLLPSLVMRVAAGINNVIYKGIPCVTNVNSFTTVLQMSEITEPKVVEEVSNFNDQCALAARNRINKLKDKAPITYGNMLTELKKLDGEAYSDMREERYPNSKLFRNMMTPELGTIERFIDEKERLIVESILKSGTGQADILYSQGPVPGVESDDPDTSKKQQVDTAGRVSCLKWWEAIKPKARASLEKDFVDRVIGSNVYAKVDSCQNKIVRGADNEGGIGADDELVKGDKATCLTNIKNDFGEEQLEDNLLSAGLVNINQPGELSMHDKDRQKVATIGTLGVVGAVLSVFMGKAEVLTAIADNAASFYAQMFFYRVLLQMLQPMLLMGLFCFWGLYLIIADYRWDAILKGLIMIMVISMLPSLWAISQYLDGALWHALYPDIDSLSKEVRRVNQSYVERVILDAANTVFNIIFPLILMYWVAEAGSAKATQAYSSSTGQAENIGRTGGSMAGGAATGAGRNVGAGIDKVKDWRRNRIANKGLPPGGSKY